ncbi:MAG: hypothetical protein ACOYNL_04490 [Rickettsiales bacterium]
MSTPRIHRFDFTGLRDFRGTIVNTAVDEQLVVDLPPPPPPAPTYNEEELETARLAGRKQGYGEGFAAGQLDAAKNANGKFETANDMLSKLGDTVTEMSTLYTNMLVAESTNLTQLITSIARKVAGDALNERSHEAIKTVVDQCLPVIFSKPKLVIELSAALLDTAVERIETHLRSSGFEGELHFKGNQALALSDINLDWGTGQITRNTAALWEEIEAIIARVPLAQAFAETLNAHHTTTGD